MIKRALFAGLLLSSLANGQTFLTQGLVAYYEFSGNAKDAVGTNDGVVFGATLAKDKFGSSNSAYFFNGTNSYIQLPDSTSVFGSPDFTISIWFKPLDFPNPTNNSSAAEFLISKGQNNFELSTGSEDSGSALNFLPRFVGAGTRSEWATPAGTFQTNVWQHVVAVYSPSTNAVSLYLNGSPQALTGPASVSNSPDLGGSAFLGMRTDSTLAFKGYLDSVRIYNRALTAQEATQLFNFESQPITSLVKAVRPSFENLFVGSNYQLQVSADLSVWTNAGVPFTATNGNMAYPNYWDVQNWDGLFFRVHVAP